MFVCICACVHVCMHACVRAAGGRACVHVCAYMCANMCVKYVWACLCVHQQRDAPRAWLRRVIQAHEDGLKRMEAQLVDARDGIVKRTVAMMESKAAAFNKAMQARGKALGPKPHARAGGACCMACVLLHAGSCARHSPGGCMQCGECAARPGRQAASGRAG